MKKFIILSLLLTGCSSISVKTLPSSRYSRDLGPTTFYSVRKSKVKLIDVDDTILHFEISSEVELVNGSNDNFTADVSCLFAKKNRPIKTITAKNVYLKGQTAKLVKISHYFQDTSVYYYNVHCRADFYKVR